jgi:hypothetical protein
MDKKKIYEDFPSKNDIMDEKTMNNSQINPPRHEVSDLDRMDDIKINDTNLRNSVAVENKVIEGENNRNSINKNAEIGEPVDNNLMKFETLDEPVSQTLKRDLLRILHKLEYVLIPRFNADKSKDLQNWDLWGPLLFCLILCM